MAKPVIGVTSYAPAQVRWGVWDVAAALIPMSYLEMVGRAGGRALIVPPDDDAIEETLDVLDGILFSGGEDIDPAQYGAEPHPETRGVDAKRDFAELALMRAALERDMPMLAVCRGSQVLNVARGGDLVQHLPEAMGHENHRQTPGTFDDHGVKLDPRSRVGGLLGEQAPVKSGHHQGFGRLGDGLRATAWADDGTVEGLEDESKRFAVGVLWHPEEGEDAALVEELVRQARAYREGRRT